MSTKLESLAAFESKSINKMEMSKIRGGINAPGETGGGTVCVPSHTSASGCMAYSSDTSTANGMAYAPSNGSRANSDVTLPC